MTHKSLKNRQLHQVIVVMLVTAVISFVAVTLLKKEESHISKSSCTSICVSITSEGMSPDTLTVRVGDTVQFNSADGQTHNIGLGAGDDESKPHDDHAIQHEHIGDYVSGDFKSDEAWRVTFKQVGTYKFHDHYNPKQNILVVVYTPTSSK